MTFVFLWAFATLLLTLAVKQVSYALIDGSLFSSLRRNIHNLARDRVFGFRTLSELFTCKLCMTMQVSLWGVAIPAFLAGFEFGLWEDFLGPSYSNFWGIVITALVAFWYGMGISGAALGLWNFLEYPAKRYENLLFEFNEAKRVIEDLEQVGASQGIEINSSTNLFSIKDFREFVVSLNSNCGHIGCGYARRSCRSTLTAEWLAEWTGKDSYRRNLAPKLRDALGRLLPDYFRQYSDQDDGVEDEEAFARLYDQVRQAIR